MSTNPRIPATTTGPSRQGVAVSRAEFRRGEGRRRLTASLLVRAAVALASAFTALPSGAQTVQPPFNTVYSVVDLGSIAGVPTNLGGLTFKAGDPNTILIGGNANGGTGRFHAVPVVRGAGNHITSFGTPVALGYGANNDGGVGYGPGGVLFYSKYSNNQVGQVKPGSNADDSVTNLAGIGIANSPGPLVFVPPGFRAAGRLKVGSYRGGQLYEVPLTAAANGTYTLGTATPAGTASDQVEGLIYAPIGSPVFSDQALIAVEYGAGKVVTYDTDADNNPVAGTRREFITGLSGAVGATIDPVTGDFLFATFGGGNRVVQIRGFSPPPPPATVTLTSSANPASYPASVTLTATVTGVAPVSGSVIFENNGTVISTCNGVALVSGSATCTLALAAGAYSISAVYSGNSTNSTGTGTVNQTISAILPTANTGSATNITTSGATLQGTIQWGGASTTGAFDYGTTTAYGSSAATVSANFPGNTGAGATVTGLACGTLYHYRLRATNSAGTANGVDRTFTTAACPTLTAISPNQGPLAGGTVVTLTGTGFGAGMTVGVGGAANACRPVTVASATSATCTMPAGSAGPASVIASMPGGASGAVTYTYDSVPTLTNAFPGGSTAGGWPLTLLGTAFVAGMTVSVDGVADACKPVTVLSQSLARCTMPPHAAGSVPVTVTTPGGTSGSRNALYAVAPQIASVTPLRGPTAGGTNILLEGSGFVAGMLVSVGGQTCGSLVVTGTTNAICATPAGTAGAKDVTVTTPGGTSAPATFTYDNVPTVAAVKPSQGPLAGGTTITVSGSSFVNGSTTVSVDGLACTSVIHLSDAKLTCVTPAGTAGAKSVIVTTPGGSSAAGTFTYDDVPRIDRVRPDQGPVAGGTLVTLDGAAYIAGRTSVTIGGAPCASVTVIDQTTATCVTPAGTTGVQQVILTTPGGTWDQGFFTYDDIPTVTTVNPDQGPIAGGTVITITGTAFATLATSVSVGGAACTGVSVASSTELTCTTPTGTAGVKDVTVTTPGGTSAPGFFTYDNLPVVKSVKPSQGPLAGGTTITITGSSFVAGSTTVVVGGAACTGVAVSGDKSLTCTTPAGTSGVKDVTVTTAGGTSAPGFFTYDDVPVLDTIAPAGGPLAGGTTISLTGSSFVPGATTVVVSGSVCTIIAVTGSTSLTCTAPARPAGPAVVSVTTPGGTSNTLAFTYHALPTLATVTPAAGPTAGGTVVSLGGTGFVVGATSVTIGGSPCAAVHVSSATQLECTTPARPAGPASVVVTTPGGTGSAAAFTYDALPAVASVTPARGPLAGGTTITLAGSGFDLASTTVSVGGLACASVNVASATSLTCVTPAGAAGAASVIAITPGGSSAPGSFTYDAVPTVVSASPAGGAIAGGTTITVTGTGFIAGSTTVSIGGAACTGVAVTSATSLTCTTPAGVAGSASIAVTTPGGASNAVAFTYDAVPALFSVSPSSGPPSGGTLITLAGSDFVTGATTVTLGGLACANVTVSSPSILTCVTPAAPAGTSSLVVTTSGGSSNAVTFAYLAARLVNLATRGQVLAGDDVMIGGFVIGGTASKTVVVRARGPSLAAAGVPGVLANPLLQLFSGATPIAVNDNWGDAPNAAALQASGFAPADPLEAAVMATLPPGGYTAILSGLGQTTGVGIVEVFEVDQPATPLVNLATRGRVLTGADVMIAGLVIQGDGPQTVVIRARGPSLAAAGVPGVLANPFLQLFAGSTQIAVNDNWVNAANASQITASGFAPLDPLESAILVTLQPGAYTAIVTGAGGTTGVGIVEVFAAP